MCSSDSSTENPIVALVETSQLSDFNIVDYADVAMEMKMPIVIYTPRPIERVSVYEKALMTQNLETGECIEESVTTLTETEFVSEYTIVKPSGSMESYCYISDTRNNPEFAAALIAAVRELKEVSSSQKNDFVVAQYTGDEGAWDYHNDWQRTLYKLVSAVNDGDGWTLETTYQFDIWRSKPDIYTLKRVWMLEWSVSSLIDSGDYSTDIWGKWCGPWVSQRYISDSPHSYGSTNEQLWDWGPTTSTGSWTYQISAAVQVSSTSSLSIGVQKQWDKPDVTITDTSSQGSDYTKWSETFTGPDYFWWPISYAPSSASHNTYISYRASEWRFTSSDLTYDTSQYVKTTIKYDDGFYWVVWPVVIGWYRYSYYVSYTNPTHVYG